MKNSQENKLTMYFAVVEVCKKHMSSIQSLPALLAAFNAFLVLVGKIEAAFQKTELNIKGLAEEKKKLKLEASQKAEFIANAIFAYAETIKDDVLKSSVKYSRSSLYFIRDTTCLERCRLIEEIATTQLANLSDFGITTATIQGFKTTVDSYDLVLSKPREASTEKRNAFADLEVLFAESDALLKNVMDKLTSSFAVSDTRFHSKYNTARNIIEHGRRVTAITGVVRDAITGLAIPQANITIEGTSPTQEFIKLTAKTNDLGVFRIKDLTDGNYSITIEKDGYVRGIEKSDIRRGKTSRIEIGLEKEQSG